MRSLSPIAAVHKKARMHVLTPQHRASAARRSSALGLALLLAAGVGSAGLLAQEPELPRIEHDALRCVVKDRFALVDATVRPASNVARARVYFTSSAGDEYYAVELRPLGDERFQARLPKPKGKAGPLVYFLEVVSLGGELQRTPEVQLEVVKDARQCPDGGRVAAAGSDGDVTLLGSTPRPAKPRGFSGVARVLSPEAAEAEASAASSQPSHAAPPSPAPAPEPTPVPAPTPTPRTWPTPPPVATLPQPTPSPLAPASPGVPPPSQAAPIEYAVGPEDIVKVAVVGHDDLAPTLLVQADGTFIFPLIGRVRVADLTPSEIEKKIAGLLAQGFIRNPQVTVTVQEYRSKSVMVLGEVSRPGPYPLSGSLRVVEVLAKAGLLPSASHEIQVVRPLGAADRPILPAEVAGMPGAELTASKQAEIFKVDLRAVQLGDLDKNMALRPNDTVFVPPAAKFYVTGEARNAGAYTLTPGITVREAVILAGGFTDNAAAGRTRVIRQIDGQKREIKVKLEDPVQPGDIIVVKGKLF